MAAQISRDRQRHEGADRDGDGTAPKARLAARTERIAPLVEDLANWLRRQRGALSPKAETAKAMDYALK